MIHGFVEAMPSKRTNKFPESGRGPGHVTPTIFVSTVGYPSDSLASCLLYQPEISRYCLLFTTVSCRSCGTIMFTPNSGITAMLFSLQYSDAYVLPIDKFTVYGTLQKIFKLTYYVT